MRRDALRHRSWFKACREMAQVTLLGRRSGKVGIAEGEEGKSFGAEVAGEGGGGAARAQGEEVFVVCVEVKESEEDRGEGDNEEGLFCAGCGGLLRIS